MTTLIIFRRLVDVESRFRTQHRGECAGIPIAYAISLFYLLLNCCVLKTKKKRTLYSTLYDLINSNIQSSKISIRTSLLHGPPSRILFWFNLYGLKIVFGLLFCHQQTMSKKQKQTTRTLPLLNWKLT